MPEEQSRPATYRDLVAAESIRAGIPPELAFAVIAQESGGNPNAVSPKGARGFFQLMPPTAAALGVDPDDPVQNIYGGITYLKQMLDQHDGDVPLALAAYNAGPTAVKRAGGIPDFPETRAYVEGVIGRLVGASGGGPPGSIAPGAEVWSAYGAEPLPNFVPEAPSQIPPPTRESWPEWGARQGMEVLSGFDPRTREGRRNLAGGAGAALGTTAAVLTAPAWAPAGLATGAIVGAGGLVGAALGGMAAEEGEQFVGTAPESAVEVLKAGGQQAAYEILGQGFVLPFRFVGRRMRAVAIHKAVGEKLGTARRAMIGEFEKAVEAATNAYRKTRQGIAEGLRGVRRETRDVLYGTQRRVAEDVGAARTAAEQAAYDARLAKLEGVQAAGDTLRANTQAARAAAEAAPAAAEAAYADLVGMAPSAAQAGKAVHQVVTGPATAYKNELGQAVDKAAQAGPDVDIRPLKEEALRILEQLRRTATAFPKRPPEASAVTAAVEAGTKKKLTGMAGRMQERGAYEQGGTRAILEQQAAAGDAHAAHLLESLGIVEQAQAEAAKDLPSHPALGIIPQILNAADTVSFHDAHLWKSELQQALALKGAYDETVHSQATNITKTLTATLRDTLRGFAPYDKATAAYAPVAKVLNEGYAEDLAKIILDNPEKLALSISWDNPTGLQMMQEILLTYAAEGGEPEMGRAAWNLLRASWMNEHVIAGGLEGLGKRLGNLTRPGNRAEFASILLGDDAGQAVLGRLRRVAADYEAALAAKPAMLEAAREAQRQGLRVAKAEGEAARRAIELEQRGKVAAAQQAGEAAIEQQRLQNRGRIEDLRRKGETALEADYAGIAEARLARKTAARTPTELEKAYAASTIPSTMMTGEQVAAHSLRAAFVQGIWGLLSTVRLLDGPKSADLLKWAAYSDANAGRISKILQFLVGKEFAGWTPTPAIIADIARDVHSFMRGDQGAADRVGTPPPTAGGPGPLVGTAPPGVAGARR